MRQAISRREAPARNERFALVAVLALLVTFLGSTVWILN
jgi:hypothetical protein